MLTEKEIEVLTLRKNGFKQIEIAKKLKISQPGVSSFERSISHKIKDSVILLDLIKELEVDVSKLRKEARKEAKNKE